MAKQVLLAHMSPHALIVDVDHIAAILKFCSDPPVDIIREMQSDFLNLTIQIRIFAILIYIISYKYEMLCALPTSLTMSIVPFAVGEIEKDYLGGRIDASH
jgi:hypothetical protein